MVKQRFKPFQKAKDAKEFWDNAEEPQEGLVPLFNSPFYATPDTPADPMDCNRYPDSPYCGGFPFAKEPISLEINLVKDECNLGLQVSGVLGFIKTPAFQIVYRNPNCALPDPAPPPEKTLDPFEKRIEIPLRLCDSNIYFVFTSHYYSYEDGKGTEIGLSEVEIISELIKVEYPYTGNITVGSISYPQPANLKISLSIRGKDTENTAHKRAFGNVSQSAQELFKSRGGIIQGDPTEEYTIWKLEQSAIVDFYFSTNTGAFSIVINDSNENDFVFLPPDPYLLSLSEADINENISVGNNYRRVLKSEEFQGFSREFSDFPKAVPSYYEPRFLTITGTGGDAYGFYYTYKTYNLEIQSRIREVIQVCGNYDKPNLPPPPPKKMSCCPNVQQNDQLLKLILKKIGSTQLPATVPKVLTNRQKGTMKIESLAEFTAYTVKQLDAVCGRYPIDIEIEDADLTKEGNQTKKLKLPNIAETLAEMMGMLLVLRSESDATLNATIRALTEAGSAKQMAFMAYEYAKANAEFLGYKGEQKERKIPFAFKPGEARLDKMLVEGEMSVKGWENEDKDDFNDLIAPLLELAAMWKVANYRKTGAGDPRESIKKFLKNAGKLSDDIDAGILLEKVKAYNAKDDKDKSPKDLKDDWDKFTEEAEKGFISQPGITDKENPYGRPLEERPRIRDISSDTSEEK